MYFSIKEANSKYKLDILPFNAKSTNAWKIYKKIIPSFPHFNNNHVTTLIRYIKSAEEHLFLTCEETRWITTYDDISSKLSNWDYDKTTKEYKSIYMKYHKDFNNLELTDPRTFEDIKSEEREIFVMHESRNDIVPFLTFLMHNVNNNEWHVSFNGLGFDSQITEHCLAKGHDLLDMTGDEIAAIIRARTAVSTQFKSLIVTNPVKKEMAKVLLKF